MDSDLAESISALRDVLSRRGTAPKFGTTDPELIAALRRKLRIPRRYRDFLANSDPLDLETTTPTERVRLLPSADLEQEQVGYCLDDAREPIAAPTPAGWRAGWVIIAHSALLGDPYFLDISKPDPEGDCPVYTAMSGTDSWKPRLCASSFALFLRILALGMEVAQGFADEDFDMDDEHVFREALGPKIREYDPAALKAGHWT